MNAHERKQKSEKQLLALGITLNDILPPLEEENVVVLRSPEEVAERILILSYLNCVAADPSLRQESMRFLIHEKLWDKTSDEEKALFHKSPLTDDDVTNIFWRSESIWCLLWVINKIEKLELLDKEADLHEIFPYLPGFFDSTQAFIQTATIRSVSAILDEADFIFRLNWAFREAQQRGSQLTLNPGIAYERYFALSWVTQTRASWEEPV